MWIWLNSREFYYCSECATPVKWYEKTGVGSCECQAFIPGNKEASVPPSSLKGAYKKRVR